MFVLTRGSLLLFIFFWLSASVFAQPANDACPNAINIPNVNNFCSANGGGTSVNSTDDVATTGGFGAAGCWGAGAVNDVWYKFTAVATDVTITIRGNEGSPSGGSLTRPQVALYSGTCSGTINELVCGSAPAGQNIIQIYRGGLTIGQTYLIRVDGFNANRGTFQYCVNNYFPVPAPNGDCPTGVVLCDKSSFSVPDVTGAGSNSTEMNSAACFDYDPLTGNVESSSTWYVFTFATSGTFNFNITPSNINDDIDFALFRLPNGIGNCGGKVTVRCMASSCTGSTGLNTSASDTEEPPGCVSPQDNYVSQVNVTAGQTYALAINNFTSTGNGFNITFGGSANFQGPVSDINDSDADDNICIGESITYTDASNPPPAGTLTNWTWNFGVDATPQTSTAQNPPSVTYSTPGVKTVTLTVRSDRGCLVTGTKTITVGSQPVSVSVAASANPICTGTNVTFTATPVNGGSSPSYQWFLNGNPVGTNSPTYSNASLNNNDQVRVVLTATGSCFTGSPATSNTVTMIVSSGPVVSVNSPRICSGTTATLTASGASTYTWTGGLSNGATVTTPVLNSTTSYTVTGTDAAGCSNTAVATVTVDPLPNVTVNSPTICTGTTATLTASGASTYTWTGGLPNGATVTTPVLSANTSYTVTGTDANGCTRSATSTVTVRALPNVSVNSPSICAGTTATLTASGASTYTWTGGLPNGATVTTPVLSANTSYTVTGTDASGCTNTATSNITVNPQRSTALVRTICQGQSVTIGSQTFSATGNFTVVLQTTSGCDSTVTLALTVNPVKTTALRETICEGQSVSVGGQNFTVTGIYTVVLLTSLGCDSTVTLDLTVTPQLLVEVTLTPSRNGICDGESVTFTATPVNGGTSPLYQWYYNGSPVGSNSPVYRNDSLDDNDEVWVELTSSESCIRSNPVLSEKVVMQVFRIDYSIPVISYCAGSSAAADLDIPQSGYTIAWQAGSDTLTTTDNDQYELDQTQSGSLAFSIRFGNGCRIDDVIPYTVYPVPVIEASADRGIVKYEEIVNLEVIGSPSNAYQWISVAQLDNDTIQKPSAVITLPSWFYVTATDANGCRTTDSVFVDLKDECSPDFVFVPNGFTPNFDGLNDCFELLYAPPLTEFKLVIFNRWGEKLYETGDPAACWDGYYEGEIVLVDGYSYVIGFRCYNGKYIQKTGLVHVIR